MYTVAWALIIPMQNHNKYIDQSLHNGKHLRRKTPQRHGLFRLTLVLMEEFYNLISFSNSNRREHNCIYAYSSEIQKSHGRREQSFVCIMCPPYIDNLGLFFVKYFLDLLLSLPWHEMIEIRIVIPLHKYLASLLGVGSAPTIWPSEKNIRWKR